MKGDGPCFDEMVEMGLKVCQLVSWEPENWTGEIAERVRKEAEKKSIHVTSLWAGWPGPGVWDLLDGPYTLGLVPEEYREMRVKVLKDAGDFAKKMGLPAVITHLGFIPENAKDLMSKPDIDGALVGGASLKAELFIPIIRFREN